MFDFKLKFGSRRIVFLIGGRVYKIPNFRSWVSFIRGIEENLEERYWWSADGSRKRDPKRKWNSDIPLAEIFWADRFGFLLVMERLNTDFMDGDSVKPEFSRKLENDIKKIKEWTKGFRFDDDISPKNVGYKGDRLLVIDYGFFGGTKDCYIGT